MSIVLDGTSGITTPNVASTTSTLGPLTQALNLGSTGQIVFPATQNASANANTLDDYEEGTWTPSIGGTSTYGATNYGVYTKIGSVVTCQFRVNLVTRGTGSLGQLQGLPFASASIGTVQSGHCSYYELLNLDVIYLAFYVENNATTILFVSKSAAGRTVDNGPDVFGNGTQIFGQVAYRVA